MPEQSAVQELGELMGEAAPAVMRDEQGAEIPDPEAEEVVQEEVKAEEVETEEAATADTGEKSAEEIAEAAEAAKVAEALEAETAEADDLVAGLSHQEVVDSPAGKGLLKDLTAERAKSAALQAQLDAKAGTETQEAPAEEVVDDLGLEGFDLEKDVFTAKEVLEIVDARVGPLLTEVKSLRDESIGSSHASNKTRMAESRGALKADKTVPTGVNVDKVLNGTIAHLRENSPAVLNELIARSNPARALYDYARVAIPDIGDVIVKALNAQAEAETERAISGSSNTTVDPEKFLKQTGAENVADVFGATADLPDED